MNHLQTQTLRCRRITARSWHSFPLPLTIEVLVCVYVWKAAPGARTRGPTLALSQPSNIHHQYLKGTGKWDGS